ncbi:hypothetical protein [Winogradskyella thalassocola]|uniref:Uncharacterized protein n=1 Tax=Winogradskyella thalassocola TaxID=262004 RepID=A0A1G8B7G7_9FLAO|nr:hypothetical protein [Winogradskyella thalassocola]SDH29081.1 hypothetical protein SAMN04489796_102153 [Winogradskyella thalassocola]
MKLLQVFKKQFFRTKPQQVNVNATLTLIQPKTIMSNTFTKDEDTFMFI